MKTKVKSGQPVDEGAAVAMLGRASTRWQQLWAGLTQDCPDARPEWKQANKLSGPYCVVRSGERTLLYLIPSAGRFEAALVLGERAAAIALSDPGLNERREDISRAPRCAAGRTIRIPVERVEDLVVVRRLLHSKLTAAPK